MFVLRTLQERYGTSSNNEQRSDILVKKTWLMALGLVCLPIAAYAQTAPVLKQNQIAGMCTGAIAQGQKKGMESKQISTEARKNIGSIGAEIVPAMDKWNANASQCFDKAAKANKDLNAVRECLEHQTQDKKVTEFFVGMFASTIYALNKDLNETVDVINKTCGSEYTKQVSMAKSISSNSDNNLLNQNLTDKQTEPKGKAKGKEPGTDFLLTVLSAKKTGNECQLGFEFKNNRSKMISSNGIVGIVVDKHGKEYNLQDTTAGYVQGLLIEFPDLKANQAANGTKQIKIACEDIRSIEKLNFYKNIDVSIGDGITSIDQLSMDSNVTYIGQYSLDYNFDKVVKNEIGKKEYNQRYKNDPAFRAAEDKKEATSKCMNICQKSMEACIMQNYRIANQVCAIPMNNCMSKCK